MSIERRRFLFGCAALGCASFPQLSRAMDCVELCQAPSVTLTDADREKHELFLLAAMTLTFENWSIEKQIPDVRRAYLSAFPGRDFLEYIGHNVGCLIVNGRDEIICFEKNRNHQLNSTMEHAEARAVRRAIELLNQARFRVGSSLDGFGSMLTGFRAYTTLESCSQCSGIIDLARLSSVVFAQDDPGQHQVGNILYNLQMNKHGASQAPQPIRASFFSMFGQLEDAYAKAGGPKLGTTAFLRTVDACRIFAEAARKLDETQAKFIENRWVIAHIKAFVRLHKEALQ